MGEAVPWSGWQHRRDRVSLRVPVVAPRRHSEIGRDWLKADLSDQSSDALAALNAVASIHDVHLFDEWLSRSPNVLRKLAAHVAQTRNRYPCVKGATVRGQEEPEEGSSVLRVEFAVDLEPQQAYEFRRKLFKDWIHDLSRESELPLIVTGHPRLIAAVTAVLIAHVVLGG